jgi:hypothetical protein
MEDHRGSSSVTPSFPLSGKTSNSLRTSQLHRQPAGSAGRQDAAVAAGSRRGRGLVLAAVGAVRVVVDVRCRARRLPGGACPPAHSGPSRPIRSSVTTRREGGGADSRNRPRSPAAASAAGFRGGDSRAPRIRRREQVAETQRPDRTRDIIGISDESLLEKRGKSTGRMPTRIRRYQNELQSRKI